MTGVQTCALPICEGLIDGDVEQNANITRVEMCQLLAKALKIEASEKESTFPDTDDGYVLALAELGVIGGNPDGTFNPNGELTRAQLCKILAEAPEAPAEGEDAADTEPAGGEDAADPEPTEGEADTEPTEADSTEPTEADSKDVPKAA